MGFYRGAMSAWAWRAEWCPNEILIPRSSLEPRSPPSVNNQVFRPLPRTLQSNAGARPAGPDTTWQLHANSRPPRKANHEANAIIAGPFFCDCVRLVLAFAPRPRRWRCIRGRPGPRVFPAVLLLT